MGKFSLLDNTNIKSLCTTETNTMLYVMYTAVKKKSKFNSPSPQGGGEAWHGCVCFEQTREKNAFSPKIPLTQRGLPSASHFLWF